MVSLLFCCEKGNGILIAYSLPFSRFNFLHAIVAIWDSIRNFENKFDRYAERFALRHPYLAVFVMFIGVPLFILIAVVVSTMLIAVPMAWVFGWL